MTADKPATLPAVVQATLLEPLGDDAALEAAFKRYIALKDKLLEDDDYTWTVRWAIGDQDESKFFNKRAKAEKYGDSLKAKGIEVELGKKIKKSGCMKLGKAFGVSDWPIEERLDRAAGSAYYKVRAEAPNGQYKERTGACDRAEKGKAKASFDTIMATALTRAADRAIMALLGGETTAEEFEGVEVDGSAPPAKPQAAPKADGSTTCPRCGTLYGGAKGVLDLCPPCMDWPCCAICRECVLGVEGHMKDITKIPPRYCAKCDALAPEEKERLTKLNETFAGGKPAKQETERQRQNKRLWVAAGALYGNEAEAKVNATVRAKYNVASTKDLNDAQFAELALGVEGYARKQGKVK